MPKRTRRDSNTIGVLQHGLAEVRVIHGAPRLSKYLTPFKSYQLGFSYYHACQTGGTYLL